MISALRQRSLAPSNPLCGVLPDVHFQKTKTCCNAKHAKLVVETWSRGPHPLACSYSYLTMTLAEPVL